MKKNKYQTFGKPLLLEKKAFTLLSNAVSEFKNRQPENLEYEIHNQIAVIPIYGILSKRSEIFDSIFGMTSYGAISKMLNHALTNEEVKAIIFDSPGGEVSGLFDLADEIYTARNVKPIWAISNEETYSAAYAIASSASKIFVSRTSGVGSIGVIASHMDQSAYDEKAGFKITTIFAGDRKNDLNPHQPISDDAVTVLQEEIDRLYEMFIELVARNRNLSPRKIKDTKAGLFFGKKAVDSGLADAVKTLPDVIELMIQNLKPQLESNIMTEQNEQSASINAIKEYKNHILELAKSCSQAGELPALMDFIQRDLSPDAAKDELIARMAARQKKTEINSQVAVGDRSNSPLMDEIRKRSK